MAAQYPVPETRVLAIASHVLHGNVGNTAAAFVMQSLGCDVSALNTVQYSNHVGYGHFAGTRASPSEITSLFAGLTDSSLADFDVLLTGYIPGAAGVEAVGAIARSLKLSAQLAPGSFVYVLDPVMGDNGMLYVEEGVVAAYKDVLRTADLILPNQYEAEWLSGERIVDMESLGRAIAILHERYRVPHVLVTSIKFPTSGPTGASPSLSVVGSSRTTDLQPRMFRITVPAIDCYFSGTGDMLAGLMVVRLREAIAAVEGLSERESWLSPDEVSATDLPLARAAEKALGSMQELLMRTKEVRDRKLDGVEFVDDKAAHVARTRAAEVQLVRNTDCLWNPPVAYKAEAMNQSI